ncbi:TylF/MycF family methyltransferase [Alsobacter sp. SYSU M60028]|uniref:TylF/MycF family methyltransferase n=1 Tax=Alsobacter ponti TaxID=2962936 RepID=A0ABT1LF37_9HYPH|nr:TylF/MycF/NovP-related O-methyltransferase [Alsobacter ponti]MCP8940105.1 TylF/MycF family methyltransferase [Alsobacter ponti]
MSAELNKEGWRKRKRGVPDIRWRAHICCWAAQHGLGLDGDFVECGVHTGILSLTVCHYLSMGSVPKSFWLFDTFEGIPLDGLNEAQRRQASALNRNVYSNVWDLAQRNFAPFPNARLVRGVLPGSLDEARIERIAYLSIDLNHAPAEMATIERLWPKLSLGAIVVIDDYAFRDHEAQYEAWNDFAARQGKMIVTLPTGQGLLIR